MDITMEIHGQNNVVSRLKRLAHRILRGSDVPIQNVSEQMMAFIESDAKDRCPKLTGALSESIHVQGSFPEYRIIADALDTQGKPYGPFVELGTSKQQAQPFMWPAVRDGIGMYGPRMTSQVIAYITE